MKRGAFFALNFILLWIFLYLVYIQTTAVWVAHLPFHRPWILTLNLGFIAVMNFIFYQFLKSPEVNRRLFLSILFVAFSGEVFMRMLQHDQPFTEDVYRAPKPYVEFVGRPNGKFTIEPDKMGEPDKGKVTYQLNSLGFRAGHELALAKPKGEYRVFVLGGSTVFNGYPPEHSISGVLETLFKEKGFPNVRTYNFGVVGFVSGQELALILHTLVDYHPDLVVVYDGGNDVYQPLQYDPRPGYPCNFISYEAGYQHLSRNQPPLQLLNSVLFKSYLFRLLFRRGLQNEIVSLEDVRQNCAYGTPAWEKQVADAYIANHAKMAKLAQTYHFKLFSFLQPMIYFNTAYMNQPVQGRSPAAQYVIRVYERIKPGLNELQRTFADAPQTCVFTDLSATFKDQPQDIFWDIIHITRAGNRQIAEQIFHVINGQLPAGTRR